MKKLAILCSALLLFSFAAQAQQTGLPATGENTPLEQTDATPLFKARKKSSFLDNPDKVDFQMQIGTSVGTNLGRGAIWSNFASPSIRYNRASPLECKCGYDVCQQPVQCTSNGWYRGYRFWPSEQLPDLCLYPGTVYGQ
jgi:hypothetical protein